MNDHFDGPPITVLLARSRDGDKDASDRLAQWIENVVRNELKKRSATLASSRQRPTDVVNEVVVKMLRGNTFDSAPNRRYLATVTSRTTRNVLVDVLRRQKSKKRGGELKQVALNNIAHRIAAHGIDLLALNEAMALLAHRSPRQADIVDLRFFGGYSHREIADLLTLSVTTVESDWYAARKWLYSALHDSHP